MQLLGLNYTTNSDGKPMTTLQVADEYNSYYNNPTAGRGCVGQKVESIYVGDIDCSDLKVGMEIDITYGKAIATKTGFYQPVKDIIVLD